MQIAKKIVTVKGCVLFLAVLFAILMISGKETKGKEIETVEAKQDLSSKEEKTGGFHAFAWGSQIPLSGTKIEVTGKNYMSIGTTQQLISRCANYNGDFIYTSSDTTMATVTNLGVVTALKAGTVKITVQTEPIPGSTIVCNGTFDLTILPSNQTELISIGAYILGNTMSPGMKQVITITPYPVNAYVEQGFKYESSDASVASVDERGVITAVRDGNATITITSKDGQNIKATVSVMVSQTTGIPVTSLDIHGEHTMALGDKQVLAPLITPMNASNPRVTFTSSNPKVATVAEDGTVTALELGTTEIGVSAQDGSGVSRSFTVTVTGRKADKIELRGSTTMQVGDSQTLTTIVTPNNATNLNLKYTSSNTSVVTVSEKGYAVANAIGTAVITVETTDGSNLKQQMTITVTEKIVKVKSIALNLPGESDIAVDETRVITAVVFPLDATASDLEWYSSNEDVISISDNEITGVEPGKAIIIASATDGTGISARLSVSVYEPKGEPRTISLDGNSKMTLDSDQTLAVILNPAKTIMPDDLEWTSSNDEIVDVSDGLVTANGLGTATVTAQNEKLKASMTITVVNEELDEDEIDDFITLDNVGGTLELKEGESFTVQTNFRVDTSDQYLAWKTSNSVVASVSQKGRITARRYGKAIITVSTMDGEYAEEIEVEVSKKEYKLTFEDLTSANKLKLKKGRSKIIRYSLQADGTKAASLSWSTSKKSVAKVTEKGRVSGIKKGKAKITLRMKLVNGKTVKKSFLVVVG